MSANNPKTPKMPENHENMHEWNKKENNYEFQKLFTLGGGVSSLDDLGETLRALRKEYDDTGYFASKIIYRIPAPYWDIVAKRVWKFNDYIKKISNNKARITVSGSFDAEADNLVSQVYLVWQGDWG
jgi:hypothetical protein